MGIDWAKRNVKRGFFIFAKILPSRELGESIILVGRTSNMKSLSLRIAMMLVAVLGLWGCAPQPRHVAFNEAAFIPYGRSGSGTITGTAFANLRGDKKMEVALSSATVKLLPANDYTEEIAERHYYNRVKLEPPDPRLARYVRRTHPDDDGHFTFHGLPAGRYYVSCHLKWSVPWTYVDNDNTIWDNESKEDQWIYAEVSVANGQTVNVADWNQGK